MCRTFIYLNTMDFHNIKVGARLDEGERRYALDKDIILNSAITLT